MTVHNKEEIPILSEDGVTNVMTVYTASSGNADRVVLLMPAMGVTADYYEPLALACASSGWHAITADLRGNGRSSVRASRGTHFGYHEMVQYDWPAFVEAARKRFPSACLYILGHSLGGQLSALYLSANPGAADGLILVASCSVHFTGWDFPRSIGILVFTQTARLVSDVLGYFPGKKIGFGGTESATVIRDWAHESLTGRYKVVGSLHDFEALLRRIRLPVLAVSFDDDSFAPKRAVLNLCNKMPEAHLIHRHLVPQEVGAPEIGHFQWIRSPEPVIGEIEKWMSGLSRCQTRRST
jgi:predicted alpha/beta hydrolase